MLSTWIIQYLTSSGTMARDTVIAETHEKAVAQTRQNVPFCIIVGWQRKLKED